MSKKNLLFLLFVVLLVSCSPGKKNRAGMGNDFVKNNMENARLMLGNMLREANKKFPAEKGAFPKSINQKGELITNSMYGWTSGFFPGSLWYTYEFTQDKALEAEAVKWTEKLEPLQFFTGHHDLGFMVYCSYGNAYRLTQNEAYKNLLIQSAKSLATRFNPVVGCIKSWNTFKSWSDEQTVHHFPVIIDNMMNLELLFFASKVSGDNSFRDIAIKHAETTMKNHFRPDNSSYHVVCYDSITGKAAIKETAQGYAHNSTWARGQAWAMYGYTMTYRETKDQRFLEMAKGLSDYFVYNKTLPADKIPVWDFNAGQPGFTPPARSNALKVSTLYRDASAAAIAASALLELSTFTTGKKSADYRNTATAILKSLSNETYRAAPGTNGNFILEHSVGSLPHNSEIDVPLVYADYYYLEALSRLDKLQRKQPLM